MEYVIIGGDERFAHLARLLQRRGGDVGTLFREPVPGVPALEPAALARTRAVIVNYPYPLKGGQLEDALSRLSGAARIYLCGPKHPQAVRADRRTIDLWADEALQRQNACLTAEGAVCAAMRACSSALRDMRCMVVGWGRIGCALTELLVAVGARVTAASRSAASRNRAAERGADPADSGSIAAALPGHGLIFNTAPALVLDDAALAHADAGAMVIDLASPPYGVDLRAAWNRGLRAWREPGLPGRYCPKSAAAALLEALTRAERGVA